ncbi:MAG: hypothetical protein NUW37_01230 [Planctomycetes bacterium]|nr:hypothetical protein [Planctomycetota bacterium]
MNGFLDRLRTIFTSLGFGERLTSGVFARERNHRAAPVRPGSSVFLQTEAGDSLELITRLSAELVRSENLQPGMARKVFALAGAFQPEHLRAQTREKNAVRASAAIVGGSARRTLLEMTVLARSLLEGPAPVELSFFDTKFLESAFDRFEVPKGSREDLLLAVQQESSPDEIGGETYSGLSELLSKVGPEEQAKAVSEVLTSMNVRFFGRRSLAEIAASVRDRSASGERVPDLRNLLSAVFATLKQGGEDALENLRGIIESAGIDPSCLDESRAALEEVRALLPENVRVRFSTMGAALVDLESRFTLIASEGGPGDSWLQIASMADGGDSNHVATLDATIVPDFDETAKGGAFVLATDEESFRAACELVIDLKNEASKQGANLSLCLEPAQRSVKTAMKSIARREGSHVIFVGANEAAEGKINVKSMDSRESREFGRDDLHGVIDFLRAPGDGRAGEKDRS